MRRQIAVALLAAGLNAGPAYAEEADEIVITATRTPASVARLPARVEVLSREQIEGRGLSTLAQAAGAEAVQAGGVGQQTSLFLRGGASRHVLALYDGIRLNDAAAPNGQYDFGQDTLWGLDRVEIVRGPASAIYGSDAVAGVVNMIPRRSADAPFTARAEAAFGSLGLRRGALAVMGTLPGVEYGASTEHLGIEGFDLIPARMRTARGEADGATLANSTLNLRLDGGAFGLEALAQQRRAEVEYDSFSGGSFFDRRADDPNLESRGLQTLWRLGGDWSQRGLSVRASGGEVSGRREEWDEGALRSQARFTRSFADISARYATAQISAVAGLSFERNAVATRPEFAAPLAIVENQQALYVVGQADPSPGLTLTGALRLDDFERFGAVQTHAFGAVYALGPWRAYASHGTSFRAPSLSERFETSLFNIGNPDLAPERGRSSEAGLDWSPNPKFELGASIFRSRTTNLIAYDFLQTRNVNIGRADIEGAETFLRWSPAPSFNTRIGHSWTEARDQAGALLPRRPRHSWRFEMDFASQAHWRLGLSWQWIGARSDIVYDDDGAFASANAMTQGFDFGAVWASLNLSEAAEVFLRVDNVTDVEYEQPNAFSAPPRVGQIGVRTRF